MSEPNYGRKEKLSLQFQYRRKDLGRGPAIVFEEPGYQLDKGTAHLEVLVKRKSVQVLIVESDLPWSRMPRPERLSFRSYIIEELKKAYPCSRIDTVGLEEAIVGQ